MCTRRKAALLFFFVVVYLFVFITSRQSYSLEDRLSDDNHRKFERDILLGERDAGSYEVLPDKEKAAKLSILAEKMDENKDGFVSEQELHKWTEINHKELIIGRSRHFFEETDTDNDNLITFEEYEHSQYGDAPDNYRNTTLYRHEKSRFGYADTDKDGKLSLQEFVYFLYPEEGQHMLDAIVEESIDNMDIDGDNRISIKDFIGERILGMTAEEFQKTAKDFKENLDKNKDAFLDKEEMKSWISSDRITTASEETKHMMQHGDTNKDGKLSYDEVIAMGRELETSKATQYGKLFETDDLKEEL